MNWPYFLLVLATGMAFVQGLLPWLTPGGNRYVLPHLGWLAIACYLLSLAIVRHPGS